MAGIYFHIPYCKQACHYCDFHFSTQINSSRKMLDALLFELEQFKNFHGNESIKTIYFGGGSPSIIPHDHIKTILEKTALLFNIESECEITLEANPDDMDSNSLSFWSSVGINRLSVGIQSFIDRDLRWMNRAHNSEESVHCIELAKNAGFKNISVDLIYGIPKQSIKEWEENIRIAIAMEIQHISAYCLTIEPKTVFGKLKKDQKLSEKPDEKIELEFYSLKENLEKAGFDHYEISNFGKKEFHSKHNTSYWNGISYLGIGPSAHSFSQNTRSWNINNNQLYIKQYESGEILRNKEDLDLHSQWNERILTGLRTSKGINPAKLKENLGIDLFSEFKKTLEKNHSFLEIEAQSLKLNKEGLLLADRIAMEFFLT